MRLKKKTSGKGHKWKKGQSCLSNPGNFRHREAARGTFFQKLDGDSGLTQAAVAQHEAAFKSQITTKRVASVTKGPMEMLKGKEENPEELQRQMEELNVDEDDLRSKGKSFNTFATNITTCTIPAFEKFFCHFKPGSEQQTRMLAIHAAAQDYLKESGTPETSTSYFCSLLVTLEGVCECEEDVAATVALMARVVRCVSPSVLMARFSVVAARLNDILTTHHGCNNPSLVINTLGSLSVVLRAQERTQWTYSSTLNLLDKLLAFTIHPHHKIRKAAQYNVSAVLKASSLMQEEEKEQKHQQEKEGEGSMEGVEGQKKKGQVSVSHPAAGRVADYCLAQLRAATETDNTKTRLHLLVFLRQIFPTFTRKKVKSTCELLLSLLQLGGSLTHTSAMQAIYSLLVSHPGSHILPLDTNAALVAALTGQGAGKRSGVVPGKNDPQSASAWITVVTVAVINLCKLSREEGLQQVALWVQQLVPYWQSNHPEIREKVYQSVEAVLKECSEVCGAEYLGGAGHGLVGKVLEALAGALSLQYQQAWDQVFPAIGVTLEVLGPPCPTLALPILAHLCQLMANPALPQRRSLERAVASGVVGLGAQALLEVVPLSVTGDITTDEPSLWTLPLLARYTGAEGGTPPSLSYYVEYLVPRAAVCYQLASQLASQPTPSPLLSRTYKQVEVQVWATLPGWCRGALDADVDQALAQEAFARLLCQHIRNRPDTRLLIMESLRILLARSNPPALLTTYAKNYLPALFNIYLGGTGAMAESEPPPSTGQRQAAMATVRVYLGVAKAEVVAQLLEQILNRYLNFVALPVRRQALLDLARAFLPHLDHTHLDQVYTIAVEVVRGVVVKVRGGGGHKHVKGAYRLLEELLATSTPAATALVAARLEDLATILAKGLAGAPPPTRPPRLRCLTHVLKQLPLGLDTSHQSTLLTQVVKEAVMCCAPGASRSTNAAAFSLLATLGATLQRLHQYSPEETVRAGLKLLTAGLVGSPTLVSNTLLAIISLTYHYRAVMPQDSLDQLVKDTCALMASPSREIVGSSLSFLKSILVIFPPQVTAGHVELMTHTICHMTDDCQRKFRLKTRDIFDRLMRKFGADYITTLVPKNSLTYKRLKNLMKVAAKKQRDREVQRDTQDNSHREFSDRALPPSLEEILAEIDPDNDDDGSDNGEGGRKGKKKKKGGKEEKGGRQKKIKKTTWIKEDEEKIVDLLDASAGQAIMSRGLKSVQGRAGQSEATGGFKVDKNSGKLIITEEKRSSGGDDKAMDFTEDLNEFLELKSGAVAGRVSQVGVKRQRKISEGSQEVTQDLTAGDDSRPPAPGSTTTTRATTEKQTPHKKKKKFDYGSEFRANRAGGDMTRKDHIAPYAYVQFSKERLNKRKKAKFDGQFRSLVRGTKRSMVARNKRSVGDTARRGKAGKKM